MTEPLILDLYCCQGGASTGYQVAGFSVVGSDLSAQPRYPYPFVRADALELLRRLIRGDEMIFLGADSYNPNEGDKRVRLGRLSAIHASPPCQKHTNCQKIQGNEHPELIEPTRELLKQTGLPYVIENVPGAPLHEDLTLCGSMFGLETYRHRVFELGGFKVEQPVHPKHVARTAKMGRPAQPHEYMHVVGNFSGVDRAREIMQMPWANREGLREAIPPAYTEYIGRQLIEHVNSPATAGFSFAQENTQ